MIFFANEKLSTNDKIIKFTALENDNVLGESILDLTMKYAEITFVTFDEKTPYVTEGLLRAAFNYAANNGFYIGKCSSENAYAVIQKMNFEFIDGKYTNDIPSILMGKCCCGDKK